MAEKGLTIHNDEEVGLPSVMGLDLLMVSSLRSAFARERGRPIIKAPSWSALYSRLLDTAICTNMAARGAVMATSNAMMKLPLSRSPAPNMLP